MTLSKVSAMCKVKSACGGWVKPVNLPGKPEKPEKLEKAKKTQKFIFNCQL